MKKKIYSILLIAIAMFSGCAKDGATGPAGPQGPAGTNGSANVQVQNAYNVQFSNSNPYNISLTDASITQQIYDQGTIQVFIQYTNITSLWEAVPDGFFYPVYTSVGSVYIGCPNSQSGYSFNVKVVTIPPAARMAHLNTDWRNYEEVKKVLNLQN